MIESNVLSMYQLSKICCVLLLSFSLSLLLVPLLIKIAHKFNILDSPDGKLKTQKNSIPYLGGLAVFLSFIVTLIFNDLILYLNNYFLIGLFFLVLIGLVDDLLVMSPLVKFLCQILVSIIFLLSILHNQNNFLILPLISFWIVSIINAFNLIDVMDGLATSSALLTSMFFLVYVTLTAQDSALFLIFISFAGSLLGFLYHNKPSAKIYLGDSGSMFIGGFLSFVPFLLVRDSIVDLNNSPKLIVFFLCLLIPILELCGLIIIRLYKKIPIYQGSPDHFCLYLQKKGWSKVGILTFISLFSVVIFFVSMLYLFKLINFYVLLFFLLNFLVAWKFFVY